MSCFNKVSTITAGSDLDLTKHVNYTSGMILGVDDFTQEFAYLAGRCRWLARDALGYGTVSGLKVQVDQDGAKGARVMVLPGVALSPRGELICVSSAQCAYLNEWLAANKEDLKDFMKPPITSPPITSPPVTSPPVTSPPVVSLPAPKDELTLYVVLCYRDCPVDDVPIPGEPCRSEEELMAASRIRDDFSLELRMKAPKQTEEDKLREFVAWLRQIKIVETEASTPLSDFLQGVRDKWQPKEAPPVVSPPVTSPPITSPPASVLQINVKDFSDYMRAAFRLWATELRIVLSERKTGCSVEMTGGGELEDCVLLAELRVPLVQVSTGLKVSDSENVVLDEEKRPFLLHLRMLQEWMPGNCQAPASTPVTSPPPAVPPVKLDDLADVEVPSPQDGNVLVFDGGKWVSKEPATGGGTAVTDHGNLVGLEDDDHPQYLLIDGSRAMQGNLDAGGKNITNLSAGTADGQAVIFEQAVKRNDKAGGDLTGKYPSPTIAKLQGKALDANPTEGQVLTFRGTKWTAENLPVPTTTGGVTKHGDLTGLDADDHKIYLLTNGSRALTGDLNLGGKNITNLAAAIANDQAVVFQQALKQNDPAEGDLSGAFPKPTVARLQGFAVSPNKPQPDNILVFKDEAWTPQAPAHDVYLPLATITRLGAEPNMFEIWFNIDAPNNLAEIEKLNEKQVTCVGEDENKAVDPATHPEAFLTPIPFAPQNGIVRSARNLFRVTLRKEMPMMRFRFSLSQIEVTVNGAPAVRLDKYASDAGLKFAAHSLDRKGVVTVFVRGRQL